jgi:release factor glutamine methyltransferase
MAEALAKALRRSRDRLEAAGVPEAALDARLIVEHFSGTDRSATIANPGKLIDADAYQAIERAIERRVGGEPVHRILGFREFYGLRFQLSKETLEPRPDTETLIDALLPFIRATVERKGECRILDLGTGTGAIALALIAQDERAVAVGVDISDDALCTASRNARELGLERRFTALKSDWFEKVSGSFHAIAANPPYIPSVEIETLSADVRLHDPIRALDGGQDGLDPYRIIVREAKRFLEEDGVVAVEIGHGQGADVTELIREAGYGAAQLHRDLAGNDRVLMFANKPRP